MRIIAVDDNELALEELVLAIKAARPKDEVHGFSKPSELLAFTEKHDCHIAFLDIEMWGMNGLQLATALKKTKPMINIIFVTAHAKYMGDAFDLRASGYVMKPATIDAVEREIENLRHPVDKKTGARFFVQTFGNFEVFVYGKPVNFRNSKAKEVFAYLIDRNGAAVSNAELAAALWEDRDYDRGIASQTRKAIYTMIEVLRENNAQDVYVKSRNSIAVDTSKIVCDAYEFWKGDTIAVNAFHGEYMVQYGWAEFTAGLLSEKMYNQST